MRLYPYSLEAKDDCPAAFAAVLESGHLVCLFDGRPVVISVPTPRGVDIRLAAANTLRSRHRLNDAFIAEQEGYSHKLTLAAVKSRLQLLVDRSTLSDDARVEELAAISGKFANLQTVHDWQRYLSVSTVARAHLDRCMRTGGDFEKYVAPRLANYIETDYHQEQGKVGLGMIEPSVPGTVTACSRLAGFLQSVGWKPQAPSDVTQTAIEVLAWCEDAVEQHKNLRTEVDKRGALIQEARRDVPTAEDLLRKQLDKRGVPWSNEDNITTLAASMTKYLNDVERYGVKRWRDIAMRASEQLRSAAGDAGYNGVLADMARVYKRNVDALLKRAAEMYKAKVSQLEGTITELTAKIAGMEAQVELCLADDLQLKPTIERLTKELSDARGKYLALRDDLKTTEVEQLKRDKQAALDNRDSWRQAKLELDERLKGVTANRDSYKRSYDELKAASDHAYDVRVRERDDLTRALQTEQRYRQTAEHKHRTADDLSKRLLDQLEDSKAIAGRHLGALQDAQALAARLDADLIASNQHVRRLLDEQVQAKQIVANWAAAQADWKSREATLVERVRQLEEDRDDLATRNTVLNDTNRRLVRGQQATPKIANISTAFEPAKAAAPPVEVRPSVVPAPPAPEVPRKVTMREVPKTALNAHMAAKRVGLPLERFRQLVHDRRGPKATWRAGAGRGGALWYTESDIDTWAAQRAAQRS